ncbi:MAG: hypothetical protein SO023_00445 [Eubacterium sp.]|nr:hypothetical protein [Eubacterium sp.]
MRKKTVLWMILMVMSLAALTGCQKKKVCDWCGETKVCEEYEDGDEIGYICEDCKEDLLEFLE